MWKTTGRRPELLDGPPLPDELRYVWDWYREIHSGEAITWMEIRAWSEVTGIRLVGWEADLVRSIDRAFWRVQSDGRGPSPDKGRL